MGETPAYRYPYPDPLDHPLVGPGDFQALATAVEDTLTEPYLYDQLSGTVESGWMVTGVTVRRLGQVCYLDATVQRTGAAITPAANGDVPNAFVGAIGTGFLTGPPAPDPIAPMQFVSGGRMASWVLQPSTGSGPRLLLLAVSGGQSIGTNETLSASGMYLTADPMPAPVA